MWQKVKGSREERTYIRFVRIVDDTLGGGTGMEPPGIRLSQLSLIPKRVLTPRFRCAVPPVSSASAMTSKRSLGNTALLLPPLRVKNGRSSCRTNSGFCTRVLVFISCVLSGTPRTSSGLAKASMKGSPCACRGGNTSRDFGRPPARKLSLSETSIRWSILLRDLSSFAALS